MAAWRGGGGAGADIDRARFLPGKGQRLFDGELSALAWRLGLDLDDTSRHRLAENEAVALSGQAGKRRNMLILLKRRQNDLGRGQRFAVKQYVDRLDLRPIDEGLPDAVAEEICGTGGQAVHLSEISHL